MKALTFTVYGKPVAKGRPRMTRNGHVYTPQTTREYEERIRNAAMSEMGRSKILPWTDKQPLKVVIDAFFKLPKSATKKDRVDVLNHIKFPTVKADVDNIAKSILDGMNGYVYGDDAQVVDLVITKRYDCEDAFVIVTVKEVEHE